MTPSLEALANAKGTPKEISAAYREAKARGLPDGWTCTIDKRNRRKWTAPSGRSCDSIPKAIAISVELGLLPPDTKIPSGKRKRTGPPRGRPPKKAATSEAASVPDSKDVDVVDEDSVDYEEDNEPPPEPMDPESSLDGLRRAAAPTTVHWDPHGPDGRKIGWKVRIAQQNSDWLDGRIVRYDPYTHKHKIQFDSSNKRSSTAWIWLRNEQHNLHLATRIVWAHVKGFAWWPALVMETNTPEDRKEGYVTVEFFSTGEVSTLRDSEECIRDFVPGEIDPVVAKHKKKRNAKAYEMACEECKVMRQVRNDAAVFYATRAIAMANMEGDSLVGNRVEVFRNDVNYPYGDTVVGKVRQYSIFQKKWLVSFEISDRTRNKYEASWFNLSGKECKLKILDKKKKIDLLEEDLVPFLVGFESEATKTEGDLEEDRDAKLSRLLNERCRGCLEYWKKDDVKVTCHECESPCHLGCFDPPLAYDTYQRMLKEGTPIVCSRCTPCRGCYQRDIVFGSHLHPAPVSLSFPAGATLNLCSMCKDAYDSDRYCPNCAHSWDDVKFDKVRRQIEWRGGRGRKRKGGRQSGLIQDNPAPILFGSFSGDEVLPLGCKVDPSFFYPETSEWGYTEVEMLVCDSCKVWVHAGCAGIMEDEYDLTSDGKHPIYSKEFLCRVCCRRRCTEIIGELQKEDSMSLFAVPVSEKVAPNYHDVIRNPMDLQTMLERADSDEYLNYAWVREMFELMVLNALTFNRFYTRFWIEAKRYYNHCLKKVFAIIGKAAPPGRYERDIKKSFEQAEKARKMEMDRVQVDSSVEKKDLVAGSLAASVSLPKLRDSPPDELSCVPCAEVTIKSVDAFYCSWMDCCFSCGCSGAADTMLFCVDCGEAYHSFCANAPIHSMEASSVAGWRCPNCKICEISAQVSKDDSRMIFCEMCDRAFSLDLLDPPLKAAPAGLWICGQCVDCSSCKNSFDPRGASLKHWSCDPEKCYRCGGCSGLVDESALGKCSVCKRFLRAEEPEVVQCDRCETRVHCRCDVRAEEYVRTQKMASRAQKAQKKKTETYHCPSCFRPSPVDSETVATDRKEMVNWAWLSVVDGSLRPHDNYSSLELHAKLSEEIDWETRSLWKDEYLVVIREGIRIYQYARHTYGDPRIVIQYVLNNVIQLPRWMGQRALRFIHLAKKYHWEEKGAEIERVDKAVLFAKLSASFIRVAGHSLGISMQKDIACSERAQRLLVPPENSGTVELPFDPIRRSNSAIFVPDGCNLVLDAQADGKPSVQDVLASGSQLVPSQAAAAKLPVELPSALCGWKGQVETANDEISEWKDPRECCLCHLCGDDDAGVPLYEKQKGEEAASSKPPLARLGRLLPMPDGFWVHAECALWSSETWEAATDGLIHAVERARCRGAQLKCFGCGFHGATVGCNKSNCNFNYHFPCAKACGAVFTSNKQVFCAAHWSCASGMASNESQEFMKALVVAPEKKSSGDKDSAEFADVDMCHRVGSLVVHSLGAIDSKCDGFHTENYITPPGYVATRIFWSSIRPRSRTVYVLKVERSDDNKAQFSILPGDTPSEKITGSSVQKVYENLMDRVRDVNIEQFSQGDLFSKLPMYRRTRRKTFGLNGPQFFGFGLSSVRRILEASPGVEAVVAPLTESSPKYRFCFEQPTMDSILDLQRKRAAAKAEQALENSSGCARTEGIKAVARSGGTGRITRALVRSAEEDTLDVSSHTTRAGEDKAKADRHLIQIKYRRMKAVPIEQRLVARRSHIHGWGLFTKLDALKDDPIVEYMGETIRQPVADKRERGYELSGEGSCYMFRLDMKRIVDATMIGSMARFMNHSCQSNAYAKIISVDTDAGQERKIVVFANRNITAGEEITYDYKFPVEDGSLRCTCGAPNCIGRLN